MRAYAVLPFLALAALAPACGGSSPSPEACASSAEEALNVCAAGATVKGMDVSTYQSTIDWTKVKPAGVDFAFARISDGTANPDDQFKANWEGMKASGIVRGAYQYWRASADPTAQAALVASSVKAAGGIEPADDLPIVMDIETSDGAAASHHRREHEDVARRGEGVDRQGADRLHERRDVPDQRPRRTTRTTLWVANYDVSCPSMPVGLDQVGLLAEHRLGIGHGVPTGA